MTNINTPNETKITCAICDAACGTIEENKQEPMCHECFDAEAKKENRAQLTKIKTMTTTKTKKDLLREIQEDAFNKAMNTIGTINLPEEDCCLPKRLDIREDGSVFIVDGDNMLTLSAAQVSILVEARDAILGAFENGKEVTNQK